MTLMHSIKDIIIRCSCVLTYVFFIFFHFLTERMNGRRKKPRMMDESEEIITIRLLMNGKVRDFLLRIYTQE